MPTILLRLKYYNIIHTFLRTKIYQKKWQDVSFSDDRQFTTRQSESQNDSWQSSFFASNPRWRQWHGRQPPDRAAHARRDLTRRLALLLDRLHVAIFDLSYMCGNHSNSRKNRLRTAKLASNYWILVRARVFVELLILICNHIDLLWPSVL